MSFRLAFVVQRYGTSVVGGAEHHARLVAENLSLRCGFEVEVYTTSASDYLTWAPDFAEGDDELNGVKIHRFHPRYLRSTRLMKILYYALRLMRKFLGSRFRFFTVMLERMWIVAQGPYVPELSKAVQRDQSRFDAIIFFTYLYYPTLETLPLVAQKSILVPTAHDEFPFYFGRVGALLNHARLIAANTESEKNLILKVHSPRTEIRVVGLGFDYQNPSLHPKEDYALYLGRIGRAKGCQELIDFFAAYKSKNPKSSLKLRLAGKIEPDMNVPKHPDIELLGFLNEDEKWDVIGRAKFLINSSEHESLSMIALEAMASRTPLLLNGRCEVFREFSQQCPSALTYCNQSDFLERCGDLDGIDQASPSFAAKLDQSRDWVLSHYGWDKVCKKYADMIESLARTTGKN